ncbi:hypothetical protein [Mycobacterium malmoense]|uniref:hypothetical protein n=1 Tax=Mycobacterium malmoense TaxID=1780 RepID=UPI0008F942F4|nr:hypothetical protein [Mycobacterium malmoense]OIN79768.1 hypothetical protein BMG05_16615 [Mycobacterium malmoense]
MSSRELLTLLNEFPETSTFKEATERTFWVAEYLGDGQHKGKLLKLRAIGRPPPDVKVIATYIDWTHDRKLLARNTIELASLRADGHNYQPDLTGLIEPLQAILAERRNHAASELAERGKNHILAGLYGYEKR